MPEPPSSSSRARHGRPPARAGTGEASLRTRLQRLAVLPAAAVAVLAAAVVAAVASSGGSGGLTWAVTAAGVLLAGLLVGLGAHRAASEARALQDRLAAMQRASGRSRATVAEALRAVERGERPRPLPAPAPQGEASGDPLDVLAHELAQTQARSESAVGEAAALARAGASGDEQKVEVFVNLARRLQSLVHREIELLDELENEVEDPDLLKGLFHVDHLATRIRRHAENLAVLGGAVSRRQWTRPVTMTEVLRSSIAEVEQYPRVKLVPPIEGTLRGHAVADVIHLLAELVENATLYSAPQTQVLLRAQHVTAGLAVEVEDRGLGMTASEQDRMNTLLADPEQFDVGDLLSDGRIGLFVVSSLARRHGIVVELRSNIYGGVQAVLVVPSALLGQPGAEDDEQGAPHPGRATTTSLAPPPAAKAVTASPSPPASAPAPGNAAPRPAIPAPSGGAGQRALVRRGRPPAPASQPTARPAAPLAAGSQPAPRTQPVRPPRIPAPDRHVRPVPGLSAPSPAGLADTDSEARPRLPKRRRQEHLVPQLRDAPVRPAPADPSAPEPGHDPGLMAAFRRGTSLADDPEPSVPDETPASS